MFGLTTTDLALDQRNDEEYEAITHNLQAELTYYEKKQDTDKWYVGLSVQIKEIKAQRNRRMRILKRELATFPIRYQRYKQGKIMDMLLRKSKG